MGTLPEASKTRRVLVGIALACFSRDVGKVGVLRTVVRDLRCFFGRSLPADATAVSFPFVGRCPGLTCFFAVWSLHGSAIKIVDRSLRIMKPSIEKGSPYAGGVI